jgi:phospholipid-binding lipoprotein MlaA
MLSWRAAEALVAQGPTLLEQAALDKYSFVRDGYMQRRAYLLNEGKALPSYEEPAESASDLAVQAQPGGEAAAASK